MPTTKLLLFFLLFSSLLSGQNNKCNFPLVKALQQNNKEIYTVVAKGNPSRMEAQAKKMGIDFLYAVGNTAVIRGKGTDLQKMAAETCIHRMELNAQHYRVLDDSSLSKNNINPVHAGQIPLAQGYKGKDVIVGVIDTGIDYGHPDFKDSTGKSRVLWIWDQARPDSVNTPLPYNYGQEWSGPQLDSGLSNHTDYTNGGHGTKVTGVAAGNGNSAFHYRGIAPEADIIFVAIDFNNPGPTVVDAVNYIFAKAALEGKPCVINISLGDYYGSHDGTDLQAQMIDNMLDAQSGRALVAANGNGGNIPFHLGYTVTADTNFTWITNNTNTIIFDVYADTGDFRHVNFTIGASDATGNSYRGNIGFRNADSSLFTVRTDTLWNGGNRLGIISSYTDITDSLTTFSVMIQPDSLNYLWSFEATGSGYFDSWNFEYKTDNFPADTIRPDMIYYKRPDTLQTVCTSLQCSDKVISVGNYVCREGYIDVRDTFSVFPGVVDSIFDNSSLGPTRDGRIKPDISATGENIVTVGERVFMSWLAINYPFIVTQDSMHMIFGGTSAASPVVAGLAALYFEMYPTATYQQLKQDIITCAMHDVFTGPNPNNTYGYGKLDGYGALTCQNPIGIKNAVASSAAFTVYPNPNSGSMEIKLSGKEWLGSRLELTNMLGQTVHSTNLTAETQALHVTGLAPGVYFLRLGSGTNIQAQKLIIQ
jgi:subtilisin family serine protease